MFTQVSRDYMIANCYYCKYLLSFASAKSFPLITHLILSVIPHSPGEETEAQRSTSLPKVWFFTSVSQRASKSGTKISGLTGKTEPPPPRMERIPVPQS